MSALGLSLAFEIALLARWAELAHRLSTNWAGDFGSLNPAAYWAVGWSFRAMITGKMTDAAIPDSAQKPSHIAIRLPPARYIPKSTGAARMFVDEFAACPDQPVKTTQDTCPGVGSLPASAPDAPRGKTKFAFYFPWWLTPPEGDGDAGADFLSDSDLLNQGITSGSDFNGSGPGGGPK
jgi:hypothetical protein